jgi:hypothetical protein
MAGRIQNFASFVALFDVNVHWFARRALVRVEEEPEAALAKDDRHGMMLAAQPGA